MFPMYQSLLDICQFKIRNQI